MNLKIQPGLPSKTQKASLLAGLLFVLLSAASSAQQPAMQRIDIAQQLQAVADVVRQLDDLAQACQPALEDIEPGEACRTFLSAMHGSPFSAYTTQCAAIRQWRDEQITIRLEAQVQDQTDPEVLLEQIMRAEYLCGDKALQQRSQFIVPVYTALDQRVQPTLSSLLQDLRFQQLDEQRRLQDQIIGTDLRQRQQREANELYQRQQQELLRQEIQRQSLHNGDIWRN